MTEDDLTFLPLRVTRVGVGGKRSFDPTDKRRLVEACLRPDASLSGLALKAGVNANQLHKWVQACERARPPIGYNEPVASSAFVPVVAIDGPTTVMASAPGRRAAAYPESRACVVQFRSFRPPFIAGSCGVRSKQATVVAPDLTGIDQVRIPGERDQRFRIIVTGDSG